MSHDIDIERTKNKLKQLASSPITQLVNEYMALVQEEFDAIGCFIHDSKIPCEDLRGLYDAIIPKYGIDPAWQLREL